MPFIRTDSDVDALLALWLEDIGADDIERRRAGKRVRQAKFMQNNPLTWADNNRCNVSRAHALERGQLSTLKVADWRHIRDEVHHGHCAYCSTNFSADILKLEIEHVIPRRHPEGHNTPENIVPSCKSCNLFKQHSIDLVTARSYGNPSVEQTRRAVIAWMQAIRAS